MTVAGADQTDLAGALTAGHRWVGAVMAPMVVSEEAEAGVAMGLEGVAPGDEVGAEVMAWEANREILHPQLRLRTAARFCRSQLFDVSFLPASCCKLSACSVACSKTWPGQEALVTPGHACGLLCKGYALGYQKSCC